MILNSRLRKLFGTYSELKPEKFPDMVFISGCMRSGTTFLANKISQHPQLLKVGGELNNVWSEIGGAPINPVNEYRDESHANFKYSNNMAHYFSRSIDSSKRWKRKSMRKVYESKTGGGRVDYDWDNLRVLCKSPHLSNKFRYLDAIFPNSKFIYIIRDIYGQSASLKMHFKKHNTIRPMPTSDKQGWLTYSENQKEEVLDSYPDTFDVIPKMWFRLNHIAIDDIQHSLSEKVLIVKYENLVQDQSVTISKIFDFLELSLNHKKDAERIIKSGIKIYNTSTAGEPMKKWEKHLEEGEKQIVSKLIEENKALYDRINSSFNC